jgi:hypothetical protein
VPADDVDLHLVHVEALVLRDTATVFSTLPGHDFRVQYTPRRVGHTLDARASVLDMRSIVSNTRWRVLNTLLCGSHGVPADHVHLHLVHVEALRLRDTREGCSGHT